MTRMLRVRMALVGLISAALTISAWAHGDLHEQIAKVTAEINAGPATAALYFKRAELRRAHSEWAEARADYDRAEQLDPSLPVVNLGRGKVFFALGDFKAAKEDLDRAVTALPESTDALITRARVLEKSGDHLAAAADYARAIALVPRSEPDVYLERAQALAAAGDGHLDEALACLDEGLAKLGNVPALGLRAIEFEARAKRWDAALARIDRLSANAARKEGWLERRGDLLMQAGKKGEAMEAYRAASDALQALPARLRGTKAAAEAEKRLLQKRKE